MYRAEKLSAMSFRPQSTFNVRVIASMNALRHAAPWAPVQTQECTLAAGDVTRAAEKVDEYWTRSLPLILSCISSASVLEEVEDPDERAYLMKIPTTL